MTSDFERFKRWCEPEVGLPTAAETDALLSDMIGCHLAPGLARALLQKATPRQLIMHGNILGPKHHSLALLQQKICELKTSKTDCALAAEEIKNGCLESQSGWAEGDGFPEPLKCSEPDELRLGSLNWIALPLMLCGWGALLAAATLSTWI